MLAEECISKCEAFKDKKGKPLKKDQAFSLQCMDELGFGARREELIVTPPFTPAETVNTSGAEKRRGLCGRVVTAD